jgi:hypothetical protein
MPIMLPICVADSPNKSKVIMHVRSLLEYGAPVSTLYALKVAEIHYCFANMLFLYLIIQIHYALLLYVGFIGQPWL